MLLQALMWPGLVLPHVTQLLHGLESNAAWAGACLLLRLIWQVLYSPCHTVSAPPRQPVRSRLTKPGSLWLTERGCQAGHSGHGHRGVSQLSSQGKGPAESSRQTSSWERMRVSWVGGV